jgi:hypothetical protein
MRKKKLKKKLEKLFFLMFILQKKMLNGVQQWFTKILSEQLNSSSSSHTTNASMSPVEVHFTPKSSEGEEQLEEEEVSEKTGNDDIECQLQNMSKKRQEIPDYISELWDYLLDYYGGHNPTHVRHLLAGLMQNGNLWWVPVNHILARYLKSDKLLYEPYDIVSSSYGNFVLFTNEQMLICINSVGELCCESGRHIVLQDELEEKEPEIIIITDQ